MILKILKLAGSALASNFSSGQTVENGNRANALSVSQEQIVIISSLTAKGDLLQLRDALSRGLDAGLTINEIKEVIVHLYAYCGFPRSIMGLRTFMTVLDERKEKGIEDTWGNAASPIPDSPDKYTRGVETLEKLTKAKLGPKPAYQEFSPEMDVFLKEHLFADIFERDVLSYHARELVTISVLSTLGGLEPMLRGHFGICLKVGLSSNQLGEALNIIHKHIGEKEALAAQQVLEEVISNQRNDEH